MTKGQKVHTIFKIKKKGTFHFFHKKFGQLQYTDSTKALYNAKLTDQRNQYQQLR
jgi:hypothetical protein